ncbi:MAG: UDP-N-acetylmuramate dehydrogenase, partial [Candidatus Latescibacteria bacterium]|nr:UDP-N-acetylmuramate dehydrogenase [Candidatus Latescibacterota bacterium]
KIQGHGVVPGTLWSIRQEGLHVQAGAGISLARLAWFCASVGLSGVEFATGIPGVVGGSIRGNAGAHGASLGDRVETVEGMETDGGTRILSAQEVGFGYRHTRLSPSVIIISARFALTPDDPQAIRERIREYTEYRKRTQPSADQSAGCMFKNPSGDSAGRLIDLAGCKGLQVGDAVVSDRHANFIINRGQATAADTLRLIDRIRDLVLQRTGVALDLEVRVIGQEAF